ncbi:MAG TPA: hypothetical protein VFP89_13115 [Propionibacteriaceae bacterium]|nr:hypothetical protein [Propionibacteriaceae bacterium]
MAAQVDQDRTTQTRRLVAGAIGVLLVLSLLLPHVGIVGTGFGRSLLPAAVYFLNVQAAAFGPLASGGLAFALNVTYLGMALHQLGLLLAFLTFWLVAVDDLNRWLWWMMLAGGWLMTAGGLLSAAGWALLASAGVPGLLGYAWLAALVAGVTLVVEARRSRGRIDDTWFSTKPELM